MRIIPWQNLPKINSLYVNSPLEIQKKMKNLINMNIICILVFCFVFLIRIVFLPNLWIFIGILFNLITISLSVYAIYSKNPNLATFFFINITNSLFLFYPYMILQSGPSVYLTTIFQLIAIEILTILMNHSQTIWIMIFG